MFLADLFRREFCTETRLYAILLLYRLPVYTLHWDTKRVSDRNHRLVSI